MTWDEDRFDDQISSLFRLAPKSKIVTGSVLGGVGIVASVLFWEGGWVVGAAAFFALFGPVLALTGMREHSRARVFKAEMERARAEWSVLERGIRAARRDGSSVSRFLVDKGYLDFALRRRIAEELDPHRQANKEPIPKKNDGRRKIS